MKKIKIILLLIVLLNSSKLFSQEYASFLDWEIRTIAAVGFYPFYGNLSLDELQLSTYIAGPSLDFINIAYDNGWNTSKLSVFNISAYLVGLNYASLQPGSKAQFFNLGYLRLGPHYRFSGLSDNNRFALGSQIGWGFVLLGNTAHATTGYQSGIDVSFTFSWSIYDY